MKNITPKLISLFKQGFCTPQIARIARKLKENSNKSKETKLRSAKKKQSNLETACAWRETFLGS